jgi:hypothetical protein
MSFDQHWLMACIAPRYLAVGSAMEDAWADPASEFLGCCAASPMWEAHGLPGLVTADDIPVSGIGMGDLMAALTMLELAGAVECGAGGYYLRRSTDTPSADEEE